MADRSIEDAMREQIEQRAALLRATGNTVFTGTDAILCLVKAAVLAEIGKQPPGMIIYCECGSGRPAIEHRDFRLKRVKAQPLFEDKTVWFEAEEGPQPQFLRWHPNYPFWSNGSHVSYVLVPGPLPENFLVGIVVPEWAGAPCHGGI